MKLNKINIYIVMALIVFLSGCAQIAGIANKVADINDEALLSAEFTICSAASTGSIQRRYNTQELLRARQVICTKNIEVIEP